MRTMKHHTVYQVLVFGFKIPHFRRIKCPESAVPYPLIASDLKGISPYANDIEVLKEGKYANDSDSPIRKWLRDKSLTRHTNPAWDR